MSQVPEHKTIKNRPYVGNNRGGIYFPIVGKALRFGYYFKSFCISIIDKKSWKLIMRIPIKFNWFGDRDISIGKFIEFILHTNWNISLNDRKILCTCWFACYL